MLITPVLALAAALPFSVYAATTPPVALSRRGIATCDAFFNAYNGCANTHSTDVKAFFACFCTDQNVQSGICTNDGSSNESSLDLQRYYLLASCTAYMLGNEADAEACYAAKDPDTTACQKAVKDTGGGSGLQGGGPLTGGSSATSTSTTMSSSRATSSTTTGGIPSSSTTARSSSSSGGGAASASVGSLSWMSFALTVAVAGGIVFAL